MSTFTLTTDAFLAASSSIARTNLLAAQIQGLGMEAPCNKVKGMMCLWQKWQSMWGDKITWERDGELLKWCMAQYKVSKEAVIVPFVKQDLCAALVQKGLGLREATGAGKGLWQGQEGGQGAREKTPEAMAGAARGAATPVTPKAPVDGAKGLASL
ncbi:hypothetical protein C0993_008665, partial [Termitomyces sp. T159_Od127]